MSTQKLPRTAYEPAPGETYVPLTSGQSLPEFTLKSVLTGILLGVMFGAANVYLGLKSGLTISTSIPVAVLTVVAFRALARGGQKGSLLEANMSQTVGSASSSVASGVLFTTPALFMWGMDPAWMQLSLLAMAGGLVGILCMIPLRSFLIVKEHGKLPYPEGMACAEVLVASEAGGKQATPVFYGIGLGMFFKLLTDGLKAIPSSFEFALGFKAKIAASVSPALVGVGYILGLKVSTVMAAGGALSALVIIPVINLWGSGLETPFYPETELLVKDMTSGQIWNRYVRYIGAGAVATAGIMTLIKSIPTMIESFKLGIGQMRAGAEKVIDRTQLDLSFKTIGVVLALILAMLTFTPGVMGYIDDIAVRGLAAILVAIFAFFFVTVSARIVGLVGVTSNPTSGMTIATLIATSLIFYAMGWTGLEGKATALMVGTVVCIAASIAGDCSQDLKTGYVLGATPRYQQIGEMLGVITSAGVVCGVVMLLHSAVEGGLGGPELPAPQGVLMRLVIDGVIDQSLPWSLVGIGVAIAIVASFFKLPVLAFAVGVYLPLSTMAAVFLGGVLRHFLTTRGTEAQRESRRERGILASSGLVGGAGLTGVVLAMWVAVQGGGKITGLGLSYGPAVGMGLAIAAIAAILFSISMIAKAADADA